MRVETRLAVTIVVADGAPSAASIVRDLTFEVPETRLASMDHLAGPPGSESVVLFWLAPGPAPSLFADIVAWASAHDPRPGLVGVSPDGNGADSEAALAAGFDDFMIGAPSVRETAARIRAVHRRVHRPRARVGRLSFGPVVVDVDAHVLWVDGQVCTLTTMELSVVRALVRARGRALSRAALLDDAWGEGNLDVSERAVDNVILRLRRKLGRPDLIQTVRGVGFRLAAD
ncbi:MAG: response regulator transcription factor [Deltaproteobacteria bacterium]|nr:response regulator transcription factor [Deltaproteobacteria bacterium]